jgi:hypothetical protein
VTDLLSTDKLVFNQKAKLIELNNEFKIRDTQGNEVGMIRQEGQSTAKKVARFVSSLDQFMTHTVAVFNDENVRVVELTRPRKIMKSTVLVKDGVGAEVGRIVQRNMVGRIRFGLEDAQGSRSAPSTRRTGAPGTSASRTRPASRSRASRRRGRAWPRPCSPPPTTTCSR